MGPLLTWWNVGIWGTWLGAFCVREALAIWWARCPWDTFSRFVWDLQARFEWVTLGVVFVVAVLGSHLIRFASVAEGDRPTIRQQISEAKIARAEKVLAKHRAKLDGAFPSVSR